MLSPAPCPLLVPSDDLPALDAAARSDADALVLDLGRAEASGGGGARCAAALGLLSRRGAVPRAGRTIAVRIVPLRGARHGDPDADLDAVMAGKPGTLWLPGCVGLRDVQHLGAKLAVREAEHGLAAGATRIVAAPADTAAGVFTLGTLPDAGPRLQALVWDPGALAAALGVGTDASPVRRARDLLLIAAAAAGVPALDFGLPGDDLAAACRAARRDGFAGRVARWPGELPVIAAVFSGRSARPAVVPVSIGPLTPDHPGFEALQAEASREGFGFLDRLAAEWASGANRFDGPGEQLLGASDGGRLVGIGGLNRDPYAPDVAVGRLRHLYVSPAARGRGAGSALLAALLAAARPTFARVRLRTDAAAAFYVVRGFAAVADASATHAITLR